MDKENLKVEAIKHGKSRIATFKKRKTNLLKKAREFTILCGVQLCCIIYGPKLKDMGPRPETWASEEGELINIINRYKEIAGRDNIPAQGASSSSFQENSAEEVDEDIVKVDRTLGSKKFFTWDPCFDDLSEDHLGFILSKVKLKLIAAKKKLKKMRKGEKVAREDGCRQKHLKNDKVEAYINKKVPPCNNNGSPLDGTYNCMTIVPYTPSDVGTSSSVQTHCMPENMVIDNSNPQMQIVPWLASDECNRHGGQVNTSSTVSKSPQKE